MDSLDLWCILIHSALEPHVFSLQTGEHCLLMHSCVDVQSLFRVQPALTQPNSFPS